MALDFTPELDRTFLENNFLSAEDWDIHDGFSDKNFLCDSLTLESLGINLDADEQYGLQDDSSSNSSSKSWNGAEDDTLSTIKVNLKVEPSSPSLSQSSLESVSSDNGLTDHFQIKLESPPLTPPHELSSMLLNPASLEGYAKDIEFKKSPLITMTGNLLSNVATLNRDQIKNGKPIVINGVHVVNRNVQNGSCVVGARLGAHPNGVLYANTKCVPKVVMTTNGLTNGIKVQVVNTGAKRLANGTAKMCNGTKKSRPAVPRKDANGVTIHPLIVPKVEPIQISSIPTKISMTNIPAAAKAIVFTPRNYTNCEVKPSNQTLLLSQRGLNVNHIKPSWSPQLPDESTDSEEMKAWKRQQRMIKNRESASLSRKKKKEYVESLEQKMNEVNFQNEVLRDENVNLTKRICALEEEVQRLKSLSSGYKSSTPKKYATCLLAIVLFVGINFYPFGLLNSNKYDGYVLQSHRGRGLLSFSENFEEVTASPQMSNIIKEQYYNDTLLRLHDQSSQHLMQLAKTERDLLLKRAFNCSRLADALRNLVPDKTLEKEVNEMLKKKNPRPNKKTKNLRKDKRKRQRQAQSTRWQMDSEERSLQIYDSFFTQHYENLINSLDRRHDTYYIVSFTRDHLLLPATSHNSTQRPKMSLVMPAGGNGTWDTPKDFMTMMQIDCEVTNTRTIYVPDESMHILQNETEAASSSKEVPSPTSNDPTASQHRASSSSASSNQSADPPSFHHSSHHPSHRLKSDNYSYSDNFTNS